jgi:hypothetical protein
MISRFKDCESCPTKLDFPDDWERVCKQCELKGSIHPMTERAFMLNDLVDAGCQFTVNDLTMEEWTALAHVRRFLKAREFGGMTSGS